MLVETLKIAKIGGQVINDEEQLINFLEAFAKLKGPKLLVHGGGRKATELSKDLGIEAKLVQGRRITDAATLDVVTMVYAGLINKKIVARLQAFGNQALGLCGADLNSIKSHKRPIREIDYGFVGDIDQIDAEAIGRLLEIKAVPVFCAITHDQNGQLLNTNADTIAARLAIALAESYKVQLYYCFEKNGVLLDPKRDDSVIKQLNQIEYKHLKEQKIISDGMIPKLDNAFKALEQKLEQVIICSAEAFMLQNFENATFLCP